MNKLVQTRKDAQYFTMLPNLLDDLRLSVYAVRLYFHIKRVTGETGECWQSTETLAGACDMSMGSVSNAKKELAAAGLIEIATGQNGRNLYDIVTIADIWARNIRHFENREGKLTPSPREGVEKKGATPSPHEGTPSPGETTPSPGETKNIPLNNNPLKKRDDPLAAQVFESLAQSQDWHPVTVRLILDAAAPEWDGHKLTLWLKQPAGEMDREVLRKLYGLAAMTNALRSACYRLELGEIPDPAIEVK